MSKRILCLVPYLHTPSFARRVEMLQSLGYETRALSFSRDPGEASPRPMPCPTEIVGKIRNESGGYFRRLLPLASALGKIRKAAANVDAVYAFNFDMAGVAFLATARTGVPLVLETRDVRSIMVARNPLGAAMRLAEKATLTRVKAVVTTSEGYEEYYRSWLGSKTEIVLCPNKPEEEYAALARKARTKRDFGNGEPFCVGYFGILRDPWALEVLDRLTKANPERFKARIAGIPRPEVAPDLERKLRENGNLEFLGSYSHPGGLPSLYGGVDLLLVGKAPEVPDSWSVTNRFYESCLWWKPAIVRGGTVDARKVEDFGMGLVLKSTGAAGSVGEILETSTSDFARFQDNVAKVPESEYVLKDEYRILGEALARALPQAKGASFA